MSEWFPVPRPVKAGEYAQDEQRQSLFADDGLRRGHQPWCRVCKKLVTYYRWQPVRSDLTMNSAPGSIGFEVRCHGQTLMGFLQPRMPIDTFRLEVFCEDPPHMNMVHLWWVALDGTELQPSPAYQHNAIEQGGMFKGKFGQFARRNAGLIGGGFGVVPWMILFVWWCLR